MLVGRDDGRAAAAYNCCARPAQLRNVAPSTFAPSCMGDGWAGPSVPCTNESIASTRAANMVLYIVGLGLADERDITVKCARRGLPACKGSRGWPPPRPLAPCGAPPRRPALVARESIARRPSPCRGLDAVKRSERVYLEAYTSLLLVPKEKLVRAAAERGQPWQLRGELEVPYQRRKHFTTRR